MKYDSLKKSPNGMPTWDSLIPVVMAAAIADKKWVSREFKRKIANSIPLTDDLRGLMVQSGESLIENRVGWAMSALKKAGLINQLKRGEGEVTELGEELFGKHGMKLSETILKKQPKFIQHQKMIEERKERSGEPVAFEEVAEENIEEAISRIINNHENEMATELLNRICNEEPVFFERLVVDLLVAMGYKGTSGLSRVTSATNDGGIDGVIEQDPLGISMVYVQAKRHQIANKIHRPDIDGIRLTDLVLQYNVGVRIKKTYHLYDVDEDFFAEG